MFKIYNTLSRKKEEFIPQDPDNVKMYVCGITPYDECHIGHARCYVVFDVIRRYLEFKGYKVRYIQNFTDIDDKIINKAKESLQADKLTGEQVAAGFSLRYKVKEVSEKYIADYFAQMDALNVKKADEYPKVTEHIPEIIETVKILLDKGFAYGTEQGVYFDVSKFSGYGKLSHRTKEEIMPGARVEVDEKKKDPLDFALWKTAKPDEPSWDSPWGKGRPGWHIECSVMSTGHLCASTLDIHGGGQDLIFPHHENEIAQSESATGKEFAKYWIHNGFITINKEKMSKSQGNFFTIKEVLEKYDPMVLRLFLLSAHYRQPMDFSDRELDAAKETYERMCNFSNNVNFILGSIQDLSEYLTENDQKRINEINMELLENIPWHEKVFEEAMDDDFNTPKALGIIHVLIQQANIMMKKTVPGAINISNAVSFIKNNKEQVDKWLKILGLEIKTKVTPEGFSVLITEREKARKNKDWAAADRIRDELKGKGIVIEDTPFGPRLIVR